MLTNNMQNEPQQLIEDEKEPLIDEHKKNELIDKKDIKNSNHKDDIQKI